MKRHPLLFSGLAGIFIGALLAPSGGHGGFARQVREWQSKAAAAKPASEDTIRTLAGQTHDTRLTHLLSALQEPSALKRGHDLFLATQGLSGAEIVAMMDAAKKLPVHYAAAVQDALMARWFDTDPTAAEAWVRSRPNDAHAWNAWAAHFPERALAEAHAHPHASRSAELLRNAILALPGVTDPKTTAEKLLELPADSARDEVIRDTVGKWSEKDPVAALAFARRLPPGEGRDEATGAALFNLAQKDPLQAMQIANEMPPGYWKGTRSYIPGIIAEGLANKDLAMATQWIEQMPADQRSNLARPVAWKMVARKDPVEALEWASANGVNLSDIRGPVMGIAMVRDSAETLRWIQAKPEGPERDRLLAQALDVNQGVPAGRGRDPEKFNALLGQLPPEERSQVAENLASYSGFGDKSKAAWQWIETLDDESARLAAIKGASTSDAREARFHPETAPKTPEFADAASHDAALLGAATMAKPEQAAAVIFQITDPQTRQAELDRRMPDWLHGDPVKAEAWLKQNGPATQEQIDAWKEESQWTP